MKKTWKGSGRFSQNTPGMKNAGSPKKYDLILEEASNWFTYLNGGNATATDKEFFNEWLALNPLHKRAFDELSALWIATDRLEEPVMPSDEELSEDTYNADVPIALPWQRPQVGADPGYWRSRTILMAAAIAATLLIGIGAGFNRFDYFRNSPAPKNYQTAVAETRSLILEDGSTVTLAPKSSLMVEFTAKNRLVWLKEGEAMFEVAKNPNRPFIVLARNGMTRAVGTAFDVNIRAKHVAVTVVEGIVRISQAEYTADRSDAGHIKLPETADIIGVAEVPYGKQAGYGRDLKPISVADVDVTLATSWQEGRLSYLSMPLSEVIADVNRYSKKRLIITNPKVAEMRFTGTIFQNRIDDWIVSLEKSFPVRIYKLKKQKMILVNTE